MKHSQDNSPKVSIIIPTRNRCLLLHETVESVRQQTYRNWEAIVVDDSSTDGTIEQMTQLSEQEPRIRFFERRGDRSGAPVCRNQGIAAATGDYMIFLDSDDALAPFCLEQRVRTMQADPVLDFAVFPCQLFREQPGDVALLWNQATPEPDIDRLLHLHDVPWQTTSPIWRRNALSQLGNWDENLLRWQDWEFHLRALIKGLKYKKFAEPDCFWRISTLNRETVGSSWAPEQIFCLEQLLSNVHLMLCQTQLLNEYRQRLLAGLYFWVAKQWLVHDRSQEAIQIWTVCREKQLIQTLEYWEGIWYFKVQNIGFLKRIAGKYLRMRWDKELLARRSNSFQNTPLSDDALPNNFSTDQGELIVQLG